MSALNAVALGLLVPPVAIFMLVCLFNPWYYGLACAGAMLIVEILIYSMVWYKLFFSTPDPDDDDITSDIERCASRTPQ